MSTSNSQVGNKAGNGASTALEALTAVPVPAVPVVADVVAVSPQVDLAAIMAQLAILQAENAKLAAQVAAKPVADDLRITDKGGVSFYGMGRFPATYYQEQWRKLIDNAPRIAAFLDANQAKLSTKPVKEKK